MTVDQAVTQLTALAKWGHGASFHSMWNIYVRAILRGHSRGDRPWWRALDPNERRTHDVLKSQSTADFLGSRIVVAPSPEDIRSGKGRPKGMPPRRRGFIR